MLLFIIILFVLAACGGFYLISYVLQNKNTPKAVALIHGFVAATALVLLIIYALFYNSTLFISIFFFVIAALLGVMLFSRDITGKNIPKWMALGHGLAAITGLVFLVILVFV